MPAANLKLAETAASPSLAALKAKIAPLAAEIAEGAAQRDLERDVPYWAFEKFKALGLGTLRIPVELGGPGGSISNLMEMIATLGEADSNVAHALRSHFAFTENLVLAPEAPRSRQFISQVLAGKLFGGAHTEQGTAHPGDVTTRITRDGDHFRLNGRKWYATGTAFADFAGFTALDDDGKIVSALLPVTREGISILDDWDGMGQRLTASGGVLLENVAVHADEIGRHGLASEVGRHNSTMRQLHLAAAMAGAVRAVLRDGLGYVNRNARSAAHSHADTAQQDAFVQKIVGEIAANSFAVDALIATSAALLDRSVAAFASGDAEKLEAALTEAAIAVARTQIVASQLALKAAEQMFELGGGSATSRKYNFDRHWRNIRTVLNHNPLLHKARVVGDYLINGTKTHLLEGKVF